MQHRRRMQNFQALLQHTSRRSLSDKSKPAQTAPKAEPAATCSER